MAERAASTLVTRRLGVLGVLVASVFLGPATPASAQRKRQTVVQIEVGDSIGLPLPDAKVEVFTFANGGVFWEWVPLGSEPLPAGINLLRFAYPGFVPATFSVPVREGGTLSLRVRLQPEREALGATRHPAAREIHAIGLALDGHANTDIIGRRRIIERQMIDSESVYHFGPLLGRVTNTDLSVIPASAGSFRVFSQSAAGGFRCPVQVMVNGDRRRVLPFDTFDQMFSARDVEAIEIFPAGNSVPLVYQTVRGNCGLLIVWFRSL
jgi:hypothetical protein